MLAFIFDSVSFSEWTVLLVVFLIFVGPRKIPQTARTLGNYYSKLRRAAESFKRQLMDMETEFNKAAAEVESEVKEVEDAFTSEGDESEVVPPQDAYYYPPDIDSVDSETELTPKEGADSETESGEEGLLGEAEIARDSEPAKESKEDSNVQA